MTEFEQMLNSLENYSGGHLPARGSAIAHIAWNAAIDAAIASTKDVKIRNAGVWYAHEMAEKYNVEIEKLRSE